ncbi:hypothetical protein PSV09DRAFT_1204745 [Bipolaris maydis]|nr:hypothetical protein PSV09DRAFT_1204745 [Bipolaris maydis]
MYVSKTGSLGWLARAGGSSRATYMNSVGSGTQRAKRVEDKQAGESRSGRGGDGGGAVAGVEEGRLDMCVPVRCNVDDAGHARYLAWDGQLRPVSMSASDGAEAGTGVGVRVWAWVVGEGAALCYHGSLRCSPTAPTRVSVGLAHLLRQARPRSETVPALQNYSGVVILSTTATQPGLPTINPLPARLLPPSPDTADQPYSLLARTAAYSCRPSPACLPTPRSSRR